MATITETSVTDDSLTQPDAQPDQQSRNQPKQKSALDKGWNTAMKLIRRIHLYSGLFMFPWVLLYGVTGMFFNHPRWFTGDEVRTFTAATAGSDTLANLASPDELAANVVGAINAELARQEQGDEPASDDPRVVLTDDQSPRYSGYLTFTVLADGAEHTITMDPVTGAGEIRTKHIATEKEGATTEEKPQPLSLVRRIDLESNPFLDGQQAIPPLLEEMGLPSANANGGRRSPNLTFSAQVDGEPVVVAYNLGSGVIDSSSPDENNDMDTKTFMQRMHLSRGYSPHYDTKWVWAMLVDGMFLSMVFWGLSGIFMWWQIKRTRWLGGGFLVASLAVTVMLTLAMHDNLTAAGGRGRGGSGPGGGGHSHGPAAGGNAGGSAENSETMGQRGGGGRGNRGGGFGRGRFGGNRGGAATGRGNPESDSTMTDEEMEAEFESLLDEFAP